MSKTVDETKFDALASVLMRDSRAVHGARLVMVKGIAVDEAAEEVGTSASNVYRKVSHMRHAFMLIDSAWGAK